MTCGEKAAVVRGMIDGDYVSWEQINAYLLLAESRIKNAVWPFGGAPETLEAKYDSAQCELAVRMIARRGGEGEVAHSENGVSRSYASVDDADILSRFVPHIGVM